MRHPFGPRPWLTLTVACAVTASGCGSAASSASPLTASPGSLASTGPGPGSAAAIAQSLVPSTTGPGPATTSTRAPAANTEHLRLVAIGDSIARASSCPRCIDFVDLYAQAISSATGRPVDVDNRAAIQLSALPPVQASAVLDDILVDPALRGSIASADIVLINVGFNDTPWNRIDNPCGASNLDVTVVRWSRITPSCIDRVSNEYAQTLNQILTQIDELRGCFTPPGQPPTFCSSVGKNATLLRLVTVYDDWIGEPGVSAEGARASAAADRGFVDVQCWVIAEHGGRCADAYHLLNGRNGTANAGSLLADDHTHLSQEGHRRIADALARLGYASLR